MERRSWFESLTMSAPVSCPLSPVPLQALSFATEVGAKVRVSDGD